MAYVVVWMDTDEAKLFTFLPGEVKKDSVKISAQEAKAAHDRDHHKEPTHFYHDIINKVKGATEILLVGPGVAKTHFVHHIEKHNHGDLKKKIVGVQNMDHPTDKQIVAEARKFFKAHDLFESI
ncbi:MAG: hypothetical protein BroJett041_23780 [Candidatus Jettenia caeni]|nr:MAG: hypothetical protein BroJett041_23780 [Candidatus Jettenia caeni]